MRKILLILVMLLLINLALYAQPAQIGLKGGVNFSYMSAAGATHMKMLPGFNNGFFARISMQKRWSIQPEVYYTAKGADITYNTDFADGTARYKFSYIEMPVMLVAHVTPYFNVQAGPYVAVLLDSEVKNRSGVHLFNYGAHIHTRDFNRIDAGMMLGTGFDIGALGIGVRYCQGFIKAGKERDFSGNMIRFPDATNRGIVTYISYSFN